MTQIIIKHKTISLRMNGRNEGQRKLLDFPKNSRMTFSLSMFGLLSL